MDFVEFIYGLFIVSLLGLILSFNPMLIVVDFLLVLRSKRPIFNTIMLLAGFATSVAIMFTLASMAISPDSDISIQKIKESFDLPSSVEVLAGLLLVGYGIKRYKIKSSFKSTRSLANFKLPEGPIKIFLFGLVKSTLSVSNIFAILVLARQAVVGNWSVTISTMVLVWILIIGFLPLLYIMYLHWFRHQSLNRIDEKLNVWVQKDTSSYIAYGLILIGAIFAVKGAVGFLVS